LVVAPTAVAGRALSVSFAVTNAAQRPIVGTWFDTVYLSADGVVDAADTVLGRFARPAGLAAGATYTVNVSVPLLLRAGTPLPAGYRILVKADSGNRVREPNESDNVRAATPT